MASLNKMTVIGNVGSEPEMRFTQSGKPVTSFSLATNHKYTVDGEKREETEWFKVVAWGKLAETCNQYVFKGMSVFVQGRLQLKEWEGQDGEKRSSLEITANEVLFLSRQENSAPTQDESNDIDPEDIDVPF